MCIYMSIMRLYTHSSVDAAIAIHDFPRIVLVQRMGLDGDSEGAAVTASLVGLGRISIRGRLRSVELRRLVRRIQFRAIPILNIDLPEVQALDATTLSDKAHVSGSRFHFLAWLCL